MTRHLGLDLEPDPASGRYKVDARLRGRPGRQGLDQGREGQLPDRHRRQAASRPATTTTPFLGRRLNRKVELTFNTKPEDPREPGRSSTSRSRMAAFSNLRYERWVKERRALVDKLSGGRVGYLHIKAMDQPSLAKFKKELAEFRHKEGLVIDERWNGGGNIEQELLAILVQRPTRSGSRAASSRPNRPFTGYFGPKVVLQNWRSASNAEMFPAGFRALGLGKVVGTPTMGAVIGTGQLFADRRLDDPHARRRRLPRRHGPDQHGKPRRPARRLRREHPRGQPRRPRPPARGGRQGGHEGPEAERRRGGPGISGSCRSRRRNWAGKEARQFRVLSDSDAAWPMTRLLTASAVL